MNNNNNSAFQKDDLYRNLDRINIWIANSDTKTSVAISAMGIVFAVLLSKDYAVKFKNIVANMIKNNNFFSYLYIFTVAISIVLICIGCYFLFRVLVPRTKTNLFKERGMQSESLIFFSSVANSNSYKDFSNRIEKSSESLLRNDLISQIYICSKICDEKFKNYKIGITFSLIGISSFIIVMMVGTIIT